MSDDILFSGQRYISASEAAEEFDFTRDYIARLCREGRVRGKKVGKNWYVHEVSFKEFLIGQEYSRALRSESLKSERKQAFAKENGPKMTFSASETLPRPLIRPVEHISDAAARHTQLINEVARDASSHAGLSDAAIRLVSQGVAHVPTYAVTPLAEFLHRILALTVAVVLTFGLYSVIDRQFPARVAYVGEVFSAQVNSKVSSQRASDVTTRMALSIEALRKDPQGASINAASAIGSLLTPLQARGGEVKSLTEAPRDEISTFVIRPALTASSTGNFLDIRAKEAHVDLLCIEDVCIDSSELLRAKQ
jgi:hypothetical protein